MRLRSGDGVTARRKPIRSTSCSQGIGVAEEHVEVQSTYKCFKSAEENRTEYLLHKTVNSSKRKQTWSKEEDEILIQMVKRHGSGKWSTIACSMPGRKSHQCRQRWAFNLDPAVNKQPWSEQEDITLVQAHRIHGNKWCELAKLFPGRTGHGVKNHWACIKNKKAESHLVKGLSEQFTHRPIDSLITTNKGTSTNKSVHDSSTNVHVSSEMPVSPKLEQALTGSARNPSTLNGKTSDIMHVAEDSADHKVPFAVATSQRSQQEGEITDFMAVRPNSVNTDLSPDRGLLSSSDHSDEISCSADSDSKEPHLANLADLLDMSYCDSLIIIPPDSPE